MLFLTVSSSLTAKQDTNQVEMFPGIEIVKTKIELMLVPAKKHSVFHIPEKLWKEREPDRWTHLDLWFGGARTLALQMYHIYTVNEIFEDTSSDVSSSDTYVKSSSDTCGDTCSNWLVIVILIDATV
jgi:hypothetical protein